MFYVPFRDSPLQHVCKTLVNGMIRVAANQYVVYLHSVECLDGQNPTNHFLYRGIKSGGKLRKTEETNAWGSLDK